MCRGACRRPGRSKQDVCDWKAIPLTSVTELQLLKTKSEYATNSFPYIVCRESPFFALNFLKKHAIFGLNFLKNHAIFE